MKTAVFALAVAVFAVGGQLAPRSGPAALGTLRLDFYHTGNAKE